jgi:hypothetical protein
MGFQLGVVWDAKFVRILKILPEYRRPMLFLMKFSGFAVKL